MGYKIGSLNCLSFGLGSSKQDDLFADIICKEHFDIIALQEIKSKAALKRILKRLEGRGGGVWDGRADGEVNDYAFIWNTKRIGLATYTTPQGIKKIVEPTIYKQYKDRRRQPLMRDPYYGRFTPVGKLGGSFCEFRLINTHIRFSKGKNSLYEAGAVTLRKNELNALVQSVYASISQKSYGNNMVESSYTILLGDYNLNLKSDNLSPGRPCMLDSTIITDRNKKSREILHTQKELTTIRSTTSEQSSTSDAELTPDETTASDVAGYVSNYDHFSYDKQRFSSISTVPRHIDAVQKYCTGDFQAYRQGVSDHTPIIIDLRGYPFYSASRCGYS